MKMINLPQLWRRFNDTGREVEMIRFRTIP